MANVKLLEDLFISVLKCYPVFVELLEDLVAVVIVCVLEDVLIIIIEVNHILVHHFDSLDHNTPNQKNNNI